MKMNDNLDNTDDELNGLKAIERQLLVDLTQELAKELGKKKICKRVAKLEKLANKINETTIRTIEQLSEDRIQQIQTEVMQSVAINDNVLTNTQVISEAFDDIIQKQMKIEDINDEIVEKQINLNAIRAETSRLRRLDQVMTTNLPKGVIKDTIKSYLS
ncbi:uncharacterized protein LOC128956027 [Oppia nitens]|uniref:uncharacterized protein LOC128956027 n=1 Tax=Oppia nitens TaxID=1686743 RepID=UPI0023DACE45|nr:uncharacterized protein LOC128956027 [Oppia nitens]